MIEINVILCIVALDNLFDIGCIYYIYDTVLVCKILHKGAECSVTYRQSECWLLLGRVMFWGQKLFIN